MLAARQQRNRGPQARWSQKTIVTYGWSNVIDIVENCTKSLLEGMKGKIICS